MNKTGRNDPCPCGSGKKYKKCCMETDQQAAISETVTALENQPFAYGDLHLHHEEPDFDDDYDEDIEEERSHIPDDDPYPVISAEENKLVDAWWDTYRELEEPDEIRKHLESFMIAHPALVENLGLEDEVLFELGHDYTRAGRTAEYIHFLLKVRNEFPSTYRRSAGFYDYDIITWLISEQRTGEIDHYLDYFTDQPVKFVEQLFDLADLLMATDNTRPLMFLISKTIEKVTSSHEVLAADDIVSPLVMQTLSGYLETDDAHVNVAGFIEDLKKVVPYELPSIYTVEGFWKEKIENILHPFDNWPASIPEGKMKLADRYMAMDLNFVRYLHEETGISSWVAAQHYSSLVRQ